MEKAKAAVADFVGRHGKHDTTVDERQAPAVKHEEVLPTRHENITTAIDREVDQDHYHTTVQPIKDREVLPEKHTHQMAGVQHKEFEHADAREVQARLDREAQQFRDTSTTHSTKYTKAVAPTVEAERIHHHVHETVQPVIEKEVIAPTVVHTTVPIHETHHAAPEYHGTSVLPPKTMADLKGSGQSLTGSSGIVNQDHYEGCPRPYNKEMQVGRTDADSNPHLHVSGLGSTNSADSHTTAGPHRSDMANRVDPRVDSDRDGSNPLTSTPRNNKLDSRADGGHTDAAPHTGHHERILGNETSAHGSGVSDPAGHKKPSLMDRLNPKKDADGDGKPGFMK